MEKISGSDAEEKAAEMAVRWWPGQEEKEIIEIRKYSRTFAELFKKGRQQIK